MSIMRWVGVHSRATMRAEIVGWMLGFRLDGELLRASTNRLLERAAMPFIREVVAVVSGGLAGAIVDPARVGFSLMEGD